MGRMRHAIRYNPLIVRRLLLMSVLLASLVTTSPTNARYRTNGAGGCSNFKVAVDAAEDGDVLTPMFDNNEGRNTESATITQDIIVEGGWSPPSANCQATYNNAAEMLAAGFSYGGPSQRGALDNPSGGAIVTVSSTVKNLQFYGIDFHIQQSQSTGGGGMFGSGLTGVSLRFDQVGFISDPNGGVSEASVTGNGGGLNLDINTASQLTINDTVFTDQEADNGGGFELIVRGSSHVTMNHVTVANNSASSGRGGGGRIIMHSGYVTITDSLFSGNNASVDGGALRIERAPGSTGPAEVWIVNTRFSGNTAPVNADISVSGDVIVHNLSRPAQLPLVVENVTPGSRINGITRTGNTYLVSFSAVGYQPALPGQHVHFFFDTVAPTQAGVPGTGPWFMYAGTSPFNLWGVADRPPGATAICILVANEDHSVQQQTGDCANLP
jgi:hypothetical protein